MLLIPSTSQSKFERKMFFFSQVYNSSIYQISNLGEIIFENGLRFFLYKHSFLILKMADFYSEKISTGLK